MPSHTPVGKNLFALSRALITFWVLCLVGALLTPKETAAGETLKTAEPARNLMSKGWAIGIAILWLIGSIACVPLTWALSQDVAGAWLGLAASIVMALLVALLRTKGRYVMLVVLLVLFVLATLAGSVLLWLTATGRGTHETSFIAGIIVGFSGGTLITLVQEAATPPAPATTPSAGSS